MDLESTGLSTINDQITQIGAVASRDGTRVADFETYVACEKPICRGAREVTGICDKDLAGAPTSTEALQKFFDWVQEQTVADESVVLAAYNGTGFDFPMLYHELSRTRLLPLLDRVTSLLDPLPWAREHLDRTLLKRNKMGNCSYCLGDVYAGVFGRGFSHAHTALADTNALFELCTAPAFAKLGTEAYQPCSSIKPKPKKSTTKRKFQARSLISFKKQRTEVK